MNLLFSKISFMGVGIFVCIYACAPLINQRKGPDPQELEIQMVLRYCVDAGNDLRPSGRTANAPNR